MTKRLPDPLPPAESADWTFWANRIATHFLDFHPPSPLPVRLLVIHPDWSAAQDTAARIYGGEVKPGTDGDGNLIPLPRVWRYEFELRPFYLTELPRGQSARTLLKLWSRGVS